MSERARGSGGDGKKRRRRASRPETEPEPRKPEGTGGAPESPPARHPAAAPKRPRPAPPPPVAHSITGDVRSHPRFPSVSTGRSRDVWVYLPPGYDDEPDARYPVLYCQDGQNMMDAATAFLGVEWQLDETLERLIPAGEVAPIIAVCIANTPRRAEEYTPVRDPRLGGGRGELYARFLTRELKPFVDRTYRTDPAPSSTGVLGSSLGGLLTLHLALRHHEVFGRVAAISPSYWWASGEIIRRCIGLTAAPPVHLWLDMGTHEGGIHFHGPDNPMLQQGRLARDLLCDAGMSLDEDLVYVEEEGAFHDEASWGRRLPDILRFLFPGPGGAAARTRTSTRAPVIPLEEPERPPSRQHRRRRAG